jgi:pyrimidine operon attenuation protein/uracil phosphoribosyltransferase
MTNLLPEKETILVDVKLKNGETVKVNIDELADFWTTKNDEIEVTHSGKPRRSRTK